MSSTRHYRDLIASQKPMDLVSAIYAQTEEFHMNQLVDLATEVAKLINGLIDVIEREPC